MYGTFFFCKYNDLKERIIFSGILGKKDQIKIVNLRENGFYAKKHKLFFYKNFRINILFIFNDFNIY